MYSIYLTNRVLVQSSEYRNSQYFWGIFAQSSARLHRFVVLNKLFSGNIIHSVIKMNNYVLSLPFFGLRRAVALPPVFEPVADLSGGQAGCFCQLALFPWWRVRVMSVPFP